MHKSKAQFIVVERVVRPTETQEILVNIDQIKWVNITKSAIRISDDLYLDVTEKSIKDLQEHLSQIDANDVHVEPSMIQLF